MKINDINTYLEKIDLFIFSSGFEKRSTKLGKNLKSRLVKNSVVFHLNDTYNISFKHLESVKDNLPNTEIVKYPKNEPLETFDIFLNEIYTFIKDKYRTKKLKIVIDVTAFTREVLLILIKIFSLRELNKRIDLVLVHTPAISYSEPNENLWLTKGIREIRSIIGYSGLHSPAKKLMLIILNGFEEERAERIIEAFEPFKLILGKPSQTGSLSSNLEKIAVEKYEQIKCNYQTLIEKEFEFSCHDINITKEEIIKIYNKYHDEYNIVISPLNNKVSTIAVAIAALECDEIQVCYASANQYNIDAPHEACDYYLCYNFYEFLSM
ncbi:hypothetical protein [Emticicia agri]|uniref:Uncharacterized protein n=1 Tax=Emticicia agri TaxID=2492393 RepID=A0A4V1ZCM4_9BACT|nr:hypothetical protein [Emticicia agri]RYU93170.1 hypothetical protein EWM59_23345 [Emticicia agri]